MPHIEFTRRRFNKAILGISLGSLAGKALGAETANDAGDPLAPWRGNVKVSPVAPGAPGHTIHTYYLTTPESPDGSRVLYYASDAADGQAGRLVVQNRATGEAKVVADDLVTEDAHRAALQQWSGGGKYVAFHNFLPGNECQVEAVNVETGERRVLAKNRLLGVGSPHLDLVPIYAPHWKASDFRDLELLNVVTGEICRPAMTADGAKKAYPELLGKIFGEKPVSVFFPILSPDGTRLFFKPASPGTTGDPHSMQASAREGIIGYDLKAEKFLFMQGTWGHPAWHPDSRHVLNINGYVTDSDTGKVSRIPNVPKLPGSHPSYGPDGALYASDGGGEPWQKPPGWWVSGVGNATTGEFVVIFAADNSKGAKSWRKSHPHPIFSPDGKRLYFNVSADGHTRLHVAEAGA